MTNHTLDTFCVPPAARKLTPFQNFALGYLLKSDAVWVTSWCLIDGFCRETGAPRPRLATSHRRSLNLLLKTKQILSNWREDAYAHQTRHAYPLPPKEPSP
jgi:hypothetical protein